MNTTQLHRLEEQHASAARLALSLRRKFTLAASAEGREFGPAELAAMRSAENDANGLQERIERAQGDAAMTAQLQKITGDLTSGGGRPSHDGFRSMGEQFVNDPKYREFIKDGAHRSGSAWSSPAVEFHATTLTEGAGSGAGLMRTEFLPGVYELPTQPRRVLDLFAQGTTSASQVTFMKEITFTNAAAPVAEGAAKPESTLVVDPASSPTQKIAHWIPVTSEILEDFDGTQDYVNGRLRAGLETKTDDQVINGSGVSPQLEGILARTGLATPMARVAQSNADIIAAQISAIEQATLMSVDAIVMNPANWLAVQLLKAADGTYISGAGPIGAPAPPMLWGRRVCVTPVIAAGTALVGCFLSAATVLHHGGIRTHASTSHANFFIENRVALLSERRLNLVVFRASAFGIVTNLSA